MASIEYGRLNPLASCLLEGVGVRYECVRVSSALEANNPKEEVVVYRSGIIEVPLAEGRRHTPVQESLHHLRLCHG